jgi:hypothetical protein
MAVIIRRPRARIWRALGLILLMLMCVGSIVLVVLMDQTSLVGMAYLRAVNSGQAWAAEILGDQYSDDRDWHQRFFQLDIQRDMSYLSGADITDVTTTREQTLSGQWVTVVRFNWRPTDVGRWQPAALRVKTDKWFVFTYIRAVEEMAP